MAQAAVAVSVSLAVSVSVSVSVTASMAQLTHHLCARVCVSLQTGSSLSLACSCRHVAEFAKSLSCQAATRSAFSA